MKLIVKDGTVVPFEDIDKIYIAEVDNRFTAGTHWEISITTYDGESFLIEKIDDERLARKCAQELVDDINEELSR